MLISYSRKQHLIVQRGDQPAPEELVLFWGPHNLKRNGDQLKAAQRVASNVDDED